MLGVLTPVTQARGCSTLFGCDVLGWMPAFVTKKDTIDNRT